MGREDAKALIVMHGGKFVSNVSKKTSYVIVGENSGSKLQKAESLGVERLNESEFLELTGKK